MRGAAILFTLALALPSCSTSLPVPPTGPHSAGSSIEVPYPPPAARVEIIPEPSMPEADMVWIDGQWEWRGRRWVWKQGEWQLPQPGAYYAPSLTVRLSNGALFWFPGAWELESAQAP